MESSITHRESRQPPLRAVVEIVDGELKIYAIADSDEQAKQIVDTLLLWKSNA
jgi:hypothetical protein